MKHFSIIQKNKAKGNFIWSIRIFNTDTKEIKFVSTKTKNKKDALDILSAYQRDDIKGISKDCVDLNKTIKNWLDTTSNTISRRTYVQYKKNIEPLQEYATEKPQDLKNINAIEINELYNKVTENSNIPKKRYIHSIWNIFFNWAFNLYNINSRNPLKSIKQPKKEKKEKDFWTLEELNIILDATKDKELRLCFAFMAFAGLRIAETLNLKWEHITNNIIVKGKGSKTCVLPINKRLLKEIELYKNDKKEKLKDDIFSINYHYVITNLKRICKIKNLCRGHITPHRFRHSFASNLLRLGANIIAVSKLMRHESPSMTLNIYSHIISTDLEKTSNLIQ